MVIVIFHTLLNSCNIYTMLIRNIFSCVYAIWCISFRPFSCPFHKKIFSNFAAQQTKEAIGTIYYSFLSMISTNRFKKNRKTDKSTSKSASYQWQREAGKFFGFQNLFFDDFFSIESYCNDEEMDVSDCELFGVMLCWNFSSLLLANWCFHFSWMNIQPALILQCFLTFPYFSPQRFTTRVCQPIHHTIKRENWFAPVYYLFWIIENFTISYPHLPNIFPLIRCVYEINEGKMLTIPQMGINFVEKTKRKRCCWVWFWVSQWRNSINLLNFFSFWCKSNEHMTPSGSKFLGGIFRRN